MLQLCWYFCLSLAHLLVSRFALSSALDTSLPTSSDNILLQGEWAVLQPSPGTNPSAVTFVTPLRMLTFPSVVSTCPAGVCDLCNPESSFTFHGREGSRNCILCINSVLVIFIQSQAAVPNFTCYRVCWAL